MLRLLRSYDMVRKFSQSAVKRCCDEGAGYPGGRPGVNLPFNLGMGKARMTLAFALFFGPPYLAPWLVVRHQLLRES